MARRLTRNTRDGVLAGVAAGFGDYFDVDPVLVRLAFIFLCFFGGSGVAIYVVSWLLMPRDVEVIPAPAGAAYDAPPGSSAPPSGGEGAGDSEGGAPPVDRVADAAREAGQRAKEAGERAAGAARHAGEKVMSQIRENFPDESPGRGRLVGGLILIFIGSVFLAERFLGFHWWWFRDLWPLALVVVGVLMIVGAARRG